MGWQSRRHVIVAVSRGFMDCHGNLEASRGTSVGVAAATRHTGRVQR